MLDSLRARTRALCAQFPDEYWRETDLNRRYPQEFVDTLTGAGLLAALIPTEYGGLGFNLTQASVIMEEINKSGGHSAACHPRCTPWAPCCGTAATSRRTLICR